MNNNYWDNIADQYDSVYQGPWSIFENLEVESWLRKSLKSQNPISVLDIGCGTGLGFEICYDVCEVANYCGIDTSTKMLESARIRLKRIAPSVKSVLLEIDALNFLKNHPSNQFNVVVAINATCSYVLSSRAIIAHAVRVARPNGVILLSFLNRYSLRRVLSFNLSIIEHNQSRGFENDLRTSAITVTNDNLFNRIPSGINNIKIISQSILGGISEYKFTIPIEKLLRYIFPMNGHTSNMLIVKDDG